MSRLVQLDPVTCWQVLEAARMFQSVLRTINRGRSVSAETAKATADLKAAIADAERALQEAERE